MDSDRPGPNSVSGLNQIHGAGLSKLSHLSNLDFFIWRMVIIIGATHNCCEDEVLDVYVW